MNVPGLNISKETLADSTPTRSPRLSWAITIAIVIITGLAAFLVTIITHNNFDTAEGHIFRLSWALFLGLSFPALVFAARMRAPGLIEVLEKDQLPPILYLRSFQADRHANSKAKKIRLDSLDNLLTARHSNEQEVGNLMKKVGPMIAIGKPGEHLATLGAARLYVSDDHWKEVVESLIGISTIVILKLGKTEGLHWELTHLFGQKIKEVVLLLPESDDPHRESIYQYFRERYSNLLPAPIPITSENYKVLWMPMEGGIQPLENFDQILEARGIATRRIKEQEVANSTAPEKIKRIAKMLGICGLGIIAFFFLVWFLMLVFN